MVALVKVICGFCKKPFFRSAGRFNENRKLGNRPYCSKKCQFLGQRRRGFFQCGRGGCGKVFERCLSAVSSYSFCSRSCAVSVNNSKHPKRLAIYHPCEVCGKRIRGKDTLRFCSQKCRHLGIRRFSSDELIKTIRLFFSENKRTPAKREMKKVSDCAINTFGSWNLAVKAAGLEPNRSHSNRMYRRSRTLARDGHVCDSISEALVDNWLTDHGVEHECDAKYPSSNHKSDWRLSNGVFIEYFGLANDSPRYDRQIRKKRELCKMHGIRLVELYPRDLYPDLLLDKKLGIYAEIDF